MALCEICGFDNSKDLYAAVTDDSVCSICKLKYIGGLPTNPQLVQKARSALGLNDGEFLQQDNPAEAARILGRKGENGDLQGSITNSP